ncbi:MAG: undecaprenyl-diphosphatase [Phycisphaerales bacterium]|nr:MAG: undecaprenyl-diphosphatase [Phycisphaerales bacterium]
MEPWQAIVLGLVEGITEYLPVSSTGHLILASGLMGLDDQPEQARAVNAFNIVIQGGAILAVLGLYRGRVWQMLKGLVGQDAAGLRLAVNVLVAFLPAVALGLALDAWIEAHLFNAPVVLGALALGGLYMIALDKALVAPRRREQRGLGLDELRPGQALVVGLMQCVAMVPGTSRSMMTITGGVIVGLRPKDAAEFSFLLGLPTLGGACAYTLMKDLSGPGQGMFEQLGTASIVLGLAASTASAALAVRWLVGFLNRHGLAPFGYYRLVLCAALLAAMLAGLVRLGPGEASDPVSRPPEGAQHHQAQDPAEEDDVHPDGHADGAQQQADQGVAVRPGQQGQQ